MRPCGSWRRSSLKSVENPARTWRAVAKNGAQSDELMTRNKSNNYFGAETQVSATCATSFPQDAWLQKRRDSQVERGVMMIRAPETTKALLRLLVVYT